MMNPEPLLAWAREREAIRVRKERGDPWPWTEDPILRQYSFCNVRREDDRVTRWIAANIREPFADSPYLWWMLAAARQLNWPPTLQALMDAGAWPRSNRFRPESVTTVLEGFRTRKEKWHTGAYMIRAESDRRVPWFNWSKVRYIAEIVLGRLWEDRGKFTLLLADQPTLQAVHAELVKYRGWGPFMAYQTIVDMRFTRLLENASDRASWAAAGPGTIRGLNRLHGRPVRSGLKQEQALEEMLELYPLINKEIQIDLSDVPNCCCEYDKLQRVLLGEGRPRALYRHN